MLYIVLLTSSLNKTYFCYYDLSHIMVFLLLLFSLLAISLLYFGITFLCCHSKKTLHNLLLFSIDNIEKFILKHIVNYKQYCCFIIQDLDIFVLNITTQKESGEWYKNLKKETIHVTFNFLPFTIFLQVIYYLGSFIKLRGKCLFYFIL